MNNLVKEAVAEFIGTFVLVFIGAGAVAVTGLNGFDVVVPALAHGLVVVALIYTYGHISGTHINPAVTVGLLVGGHIKPMKALVFVIVQFIGGIVAAVVLFALVQGRVEVVEGSPLGDPNFGQTVGILTTDNLLAASILEGILVFFLVSAVYQCAAFGKANGYAGIAIGFTLTACILAGGPYTGASLNPARTLGPALVAGELGYVVPYFIGLFGGGVVAGLVQQYVLKPE